MRYQQLFEKNKTLNKKAFIPFFVIGDPQPDFFLKLIDTAVKAGADALELGLPFSDPVADGPVIQNTNTRLLATQTLSIQERLQLVKKIRDKYPHLPMGLLVYLNLVMGPGTENFFKTCQEVGLDSVLIADLPVEEAEPFAEIAKQYGIDLVFILPPNAEDSVYQGIARYGSGYTYVVSRRGITGDGHFKLEIDPKRLRSLQEAGAPPPIVGFGISTPEHVKEVIASGVEGAIIGSAICRLIEDNLAYPEQIQRTLLDYIQKAAAATQS